MTTTPKALPAWPDHTPADKYVDCGEVRPLSMYHLSTLLQFGEKCQQAIADSLASAGGVEVVAWLLLDQGRRAVDDFEDFERVVLRDDIGVVELERFQKAGRAERLVRQSDHLAALSKEREVADGLADVVEKLQAAISFIQNNISSDYPVGVDVNDRSICDAMDAADAALTAHRESRGAASEAKEG